MSKTFFVLLLLSVLSLGQSTTASSPQSSQPTSIQAKPEDVQSIDSILAATYEVISGPAGKKRDWDRFRSLFYPGARLIPTGKRQGESEVQARVLTPDDYIQRSAPRLEKEGFFEHVRVSPERNGRTTVSARHQQLSVGERRKALVDYDDHVAGRNTGYADPGGVLKKVKHRGGVCSEDGVESFWSGMSK